MSNAKPDVSIQTKLANLWKATAATEKLLFGDLVGMACRAVVEPDLKSLRQPLARLSKEFKFDCAELAKILTSRGKLLPNSKPVQDAARWLIAGGNRLPPELRLNIAGFFTIQKASESGDVKFFIQLGECLHNLRRKSAKQTTREIIPDARFNLYFWWQPNSRLNWPGLAYCNPSAQWKFFDILIPGFSRGHSKNYLDNERRRMGLILSKHRFISSISGTIANFCFS